MITKIGEGLWILQKENRIPVFGDIRMTMTIVLIRDFGLVLISPVPMVGTEIAVLAAIAPVRAVISPNPLHHRFLGDALKAFPAAELWGPQATVDKRQDLRFSGVLADRTPWSEELEAHKIVASQPMFEEWAFFYRPSRTLILTDLMFNLEAGRGVNWFFRRLNDCAGKLTITRLGKMTFRDRGALKAAREKFRAWNPENLVVAHGSPVIGRAAEKLHAAFQWI